MKKIAFVVVLFVVSFLSTIVGANYLYGGAKLSNPSITPKESGNSGIGNKPSIPDVNDKQDLKQPEEEDNELAVLEDVEETPAVTPGGTNNTNNNKPGNTTPPQSEKQALTTFLIVNHEGDELQIDTTNGYKYTVTGEVASKKENGRYFISLQLVAPATFTDSILNNRSLKIQNTEFKGNNLTLGEGLINGKKYVSVDLLITPGNGVVESMFKFTMDWGNGIVETYTVAVNVTQAK